MKYTQAKKVEYEARYAAMVITRLSQAKKVRDLILRGRSRYDAISKQTGVPWEFIGLTHYRECACDFRGVLHNGQLIVGTGRKTTIVPKGYGPFTTWEEAALSALKRQKLDQNTDWSIGRMAYVLEGFNGYGYQNRGLPSPYLWGGTNQYIRGKYIRDGIFDPNFVDPQMGCMPVLKLLRDAAGIVPSSPPPVSKLPTVPAPRRNPPATETAVAGSWATAAAWLHEHRLSLIVVGVALLGLYAGYKIYKRHRLARTSPKTD